MGEEWVRAAIDLGKFHGKKLATAKQWLGKKDREQERKFHDLTSSDRLLLRIADIVGEHVPERKIFRKEQNQIASWAAKAAWVSANEARSANKIAKRAQWIAIAAIIISIVFSLAVAGVCLVVQVQS